MDVEERKLFVGGIPRGTSEDTLRDHFSKYGVVSHLLVAKDQITKLPRGFAFVVFSDAASATRALQDSHVIRGRTVEVKKAIPKTEKHQEHRQRHPYGNQETASNGSGMNSDNSAGNENYYRTKKIFVGGLSSSLTDEQFRNYFEKFGRTVDAVVMQDSSNKPRGFGFVTFDSAESVAKVMRNSFHELNGKTVEVKKAVPKDRVNGDIGSCSSNGFADNGPEPENHPFYGPTHDPHYTPFLMYAGVHGYFYGMSFYGGVYPLVGFGRPVLGVSPMVPTVPFMPAAGPFPYSNACFYPAYMHDESSTWAMEVVGHNQIVEPGVNGEVDVVHDSNVHVPSNATTPPSKEGNVGSESFGLKGGDVDAVHDSNGHVDVARDSNGDVPSNATAPPSEEGKVGSGLKGGDVDAVPDNNGHVEPGVNGEVDAVHDSNGHVPSNATALPSEEGKDGSDAFGLKGGDVDAVPDINGHFEPDVNGEEVGGYNQIVEPDVNGGGDAFGDSNGHVPSNATALPSEERKVGSDALGLQGSNDGALINGIE
ncbi:PREDICTED: RNA-binding protein 1-like isoform X4 [Populus euphratica]|uniref:RNA-binding protein 1-like isoform X4 n=1 Tax=Populus euphratica TaxID=75702 RepID=A0AAJ6SWP4_POPEU|nr:PREDICTED: RNA-binding protein 1-like isoform X4 [Populus euphratica]